MLSFQVIEHSLSVEAGEGCAHLPLYSFIAEDSSCIEMRKFIFSLRSYLQTVEFKVMTKMQSINLFHNHQPSVSSLLDESPYSESQVNICISKNCTVVHKLKVRFT